MNFQVVILVVEVITEFSFLSLFIEANYSPIIDRGDRWHLPNHLLLHCY